MQPSWLPNIAKALEKEQAKEAKALENALRLQEIRIGKEEAKASKALEKEEAKAAKALEKEQAKQAKLEAKKVEREQAKAAKKVEREQAKAASKKESSFQIVENDDKVLCLQAKVDSFQRQHERAPTAEELNNMYPEVYAN